MKSSGSCRKKGYLCCEIYASCQFHAEYNSRSTIPQYIYKHRQVTKLMLKLIRKIFNGFLALFRLPLLVEKNLEITYKVSTDLKTFNT